MLFNGNHGITDSLSFIEYEPNDVKYISRGCSGYTWLYSPEPDPVCLEKESIHPSVKPGSALLSTLSHSDLQGSGAVVTGSSHSCEARIVSVHCCFG